jgi:hypothetical protein
VSAYCTVSFEDLKGYSEACDITSPAVSPHNLTYQLHRAIRDQYTVSTLLYLCIKFFMIVWLCIVTDSLWVKPTDALNSSFIGITTLHVLGSLSVHHQEFLAVHWLWYILCSCDPLLPGVGRNSWQQTVTTA